MQQPMQNTWHTVVGPSQVLTADSNGIPPCEMYELARFNARVDGLGVVNAATHRWDMRPVHHQQSQSPLPPRSQLQSCPHQRQSWWFQGDIPCTHPSCPQGCRSPCRTVAHPCLKTHSLRKRRTHTHDLCQHMNCEGVVSHCCCAQAMGVESPRPALKDTTQALFYATTVPELPAYTLKPDQHRMLLSRQRPSTVLYVEAGPTWFGHTCQDTCEAIGSKILRTCWYLGACECSRRTVTASCGCEAVGGVGHAKLGLVAVCCTPGLGQGRVVQSLPGQNDCVRK